MSDDKQTVTVTIKPEALTGPFVVDGYIAAARVESITPSAYRLAKKTDGTLVLQGAYAWTQGFSSGGHVWRDIPTVDLSAPESEGCQ